MNRSYCQELKCFQYSINKKIKQCLNCLLTCNEQFIAIQKHCEKYLNQPDLYVFKKCRGGFIVILKKPVDFFISNEMREDVINLNFAKFRGNEFFVEDIVHMITLEHVNKVDHHFRQTKTVYEVGKLVQPNFFDIDIDVVCGYGIHYYRSLLPAFYHDYNYKDHYRSIHWEANGGLAYMSIDYGHQRIIYLSFDSFNNLILKTKYINVSPIKSIHYDSDGKQIKKTIYDEKN